MKLVSSESLALANPETHDRSQYEIIDSRELARRWTLPVTWIRGHVRDGISDPIPHVRFGRYVRFRWASPELNSWLDKRTVTGNAKGKRIL